MPFEHAERAPDTGAETPKEQAAEVPEFSYDAGREEAIARIDDLLERQDVVTVGFEATGQHVGKSVLSHELRDRYFGQGTLAILEHDDADLLKRALVPDAYLEARRPAGHEGKGKTVVIFDQLLVGLGPYDAASRDKVREWQNRKTKGSLEKIGLSAHGIDLWIGLSRPDKPFNKSAGRPMADMIIVNEKAKDKK